MKIIEKIDSVLTYAMTYEYIPAFYYEIGGRGALVWNEVNTHNTMSKIGGILFGIYFLAYIIMDVELT